MAHSLFSPGSDGVRSLDAYRSSKLNTVQVNNESIETPMQDGSTDEQEHAHPLRQDFAPTIMGISELANQCIREINHSHSGVIQSESYCAELFIRATLQEDQGAWQAVQQCFKHTVRGWLDHHPNREAACRSYQAAVLQQVELSQLSSALQYLHMSLNSALLDALHASSRPLATGLQQLELGNSVKSKTCGK